MSFFNAISRLLVLSTYSTVAVISILAQESKDFDDKKILDLLPDSGMANEITEGPLSYDAETLYEYINGAAEAFIAYDFQRLVHQVYLSGGTEVTVDIYDMGTAIDAFGIYSSERGRGSDFITVGTEGYRAEEILNFVLGRYYVKLAAFAEEADTSVVLLDFAEEVARRIPARQQYPEIFSLFPALGMVPHSKSYVKRAPLGHQFLSPGYLADYRLGDDDTTVLLSPSADSKEAGRKLERLREHLGKISQVAALESLGREAFRAETKYEGNILALQHGSFAVVLVDPPDDYEEFLEGLLAGFGLQTQK